METKATTEITFLSNFSWNNPNVLELLCESAAFNNFKVRHFSKPCSILKTKNNFKNCSSIDSIEAKNLLNLSTRITTLPLGGRVQNYFLWKQIKPKCHKRVKKVLFYNNLDSLSGLSEKFRSYFDILIYLCADYSEINDHLIFNCNLADGIFVIPPTMYQLLQQRYPEKSLILWPQPVTSTFNSPLKGNQKVELDKILEKIPQPRLIYAGLGLDRLNSGIYQSIPARFPSCSFISFGGTKFKRKKNIFEIPSVSKQEMLYIISQCQVGFMPYDISDPHNLHCVPLKLFDYFSAGLPVVSSKLLNIYKYKKLLFLCETLDEFECAIQKSLCEEISSEAREKRKAVYSFHSTLKRSNEFKSCIDQFVKGSKLNA